MRWLGMDKLPRIRLRMQAVLIAAAVVATGCANSPVSLSFPLAPQPSANQPAPTINPSFATGERAAQATPEAATGESLSTSEMVRQLLVEPTSVATPRPAQKIVEEPVLGDELDPNWTMARSLGMRYTFTDAQAAHSGSRVLSVTPLKDFARLFLTVRKDAKETYSLDRVAGVSLWINSGDQPLDPNNISITVVGSNDYPYWVRDDKSVVTNETHFFSESRLYYLGIKNTVPPNTWVEAVVWLDKLPYEPDYKYVTGIYIKNDEWFRRTFYVDSVQLLVVE